MPDARRQKEQMNMPDERRQKEQMNMPDERRRKEQTTDVGIQCRRNRRRENALAELARTGHRGRRRGITKKKTRQRKVACIGHRERKGEREKGIDAKSSTKLLHYLKYANIFTFYHFFCKLPPIDENLGLKEAHNKMARIKACHFVSTLV